MSVNVDSSSVGDGAALDSCPSGAPHDWRLIGEQNRRFLDERDVLGPQVYVRRWYCTRCRRVDAVWDDPVTA